MQKFLGLLMLGAGLAYLVSENAPTLNDRDEQIAAISRIVARSTIIEPEFVPAENPGLRRPVASPAAAYITPYQPQTPPIAPAHSDVAAADRSPLQNAVLPPVSIANETATRRENNATSSAASVQRQLARQIQAELKRVGCYSGRLDGSWGDRSRSAMVSFMSRVNASLPTTEPDVYLLSLIKGQTVPVCGPSCGSGEVSSNGRCMATTVLADAAPAARTNTPAIAGSQPEPFPGRMSVGGPVPEWKAPNTASLPWQGASTQIPAEATIAALETGETPAGDEVIAPPVPLPRKVTKVKRPVAAARPGKRRYSSSRAVQQLFMHPLGRM